MHSSSISTEDGVKWHRVTQGPSKIVSITPSITNYIRPIGKVVTMLIGNVKIGVTSVSRVFLCRERAINMVLTSFRVT